MSIRLMRKEDFADAIKLSDTEEWNYGQADLELFTSLSPEGSIVAEKNGRIIGMTFAFAFPPVGTTGGIIVHPDHRLHGVGTEMLTYAIDFLERRVNMVELYSYEHTIGFYEKHGFKEHEGVSSFCGIPQVDPYEGDALTNKHKNWLFASDMEHFGGDRSRLLDNLLANSPDWAVRTSNGYGMAKGSETDAIELGPIISHDNSLFDALVSHLPKAHLEVNIPDTNLDAIDHVKAAGMAFAGHKRRMSRGINRPISSNIWALGGLELG